MAKPKLSTKDKIITKKWLIRSILQIIFLGVILYLITNFYLDKIINPNPEINLKCFKENNQSITLILHNPSSSPAEEINIMLKTRYAGGGHDYPENELCSIDRHPLLLNSVTKIFCNYIPPESSAELTLYIENESTNNFWYSLWGKTTKRIDYNILTCNRKT